MWSSKKNRKDTSAAEEKPPFEEVTSWEEAQALLPREDLEALLQVSTRLLKDLRSYYSSKFTLFLNFVASLDPAHPEHERNWNIAPYGSQAREALYELPTTQRFLSLYSENGVSSGEKEIIQEAFRKYQRELSRVIKVALERRKLLTADASDALLREMIHKPQDGPKALTTGKGMLLTISSSAASAALQDSVSKSSSLAS